MRRDGITDVPGVRVGRAEDRRIASGVTAVIFETPAVASVAILGGAPGGRDTGLLEPGRTVQEVDALVLSGGSAFGLDAMGGVQAALRAQGRGFEVGGVRVPIVPGAILFDLLNGGNKEWGAEPVYWHLGHAAALAAGSEVAEGNAGAGYGATTARLKGGLGTASARTAGGFVVGAIVAVNAIGSPTIGDGPHFWAAPYERDGEFGGLGWPATPTSADLALSLKGAVPANTTIAVVATDAVLAKAEAWRVAAMAGGGLAKAIRPSQAALDGDTVFAAATGRAARAPSAVEQVEIGALAEDCLARAVARAIFHAEALPFAGALPSWQERFAR